MIVVIQCAATKRPDAGMLEAEGGRQVLFVADPAKAPTSDRCTYARPDDIAKDDKTWRDLLLDYNEAAENPLGLAKAYELYVNPAYRQLVEKLGTNGVYILSAGWGLLRADFRTPLYDITYSSTVKKEAPWKFRHQRDVYKDFKHLSAATTDRVVFMGGKDYVPLFCELTNDVRGQRTVFFNSDTPPLAPGCSLERYPTRTKTNWHYECARSLLSKM